MWVLGILFILVWGIAEEIIDTIDAKKYHQSEEYKRQQWLMDQWLHSSNNVWDKENKKK